MYVRDVTRGTRVSRAGGANVKRKNVSRGDFVSLKFLVALDVRVRAGAASGESTCTLGPAFPHRAGVLIISGHTATGATYVL